MLQTAVVQLAVWLLGLTSLTNRNRQLLTASLLTALHALPLRARIIVDEAGKIFVDGRPLNQETAQRMKQAALVMRRNFARKFVGDQINWMAVQKALHSNLTPEEGLFGKAALWVRQEEDDLYELLAGNEELDDEDEGRTL